MGADKQTRYAMRLHGVGSFILMYTHPEIADDSEMRPKPTGFRRHKHQNTLTNMLHSTHALTRPHKYTPRCIVRWNAERKGFGALCGLSDFIRTQMDPGSGRSCPFDVSNPSLTHNGTHFCGSGDNTGDLPWPH